MPRPHALTCLRLFLEHNSCRPATTIACKADVEQTLHQPASPIGYRPSLVMFGS
ncbi:hypothetical protein CCHR01_07992 [Colletotrichum chrysophilum]|uniref:Uncharacterized protein n=1 Tax=Colletotrichum chrysophilum TaxID=1836956 RepID=A0AAD9AL85_9PEZI|nr:hypothetical protein CCHR01_07992 [Colletotrichum chrysophilum]